MIGINREGKDVISGMGSMATDITKAFDSQLAIPNIQASLKNASASMNSQITHKHQIETSPTQRLVKVELDVDNDALTAIVNGKMQNVVKHSTCKGLEMDIEITKSDGSKYRLGDYDFYVNDVVISSIELDRKYESKENLNGRISTGSTYQTRTISVPCFYLTKSLADIPYVRDLLYKLVVDTEPIKIRELRKKEELNYRFIQPTSDDYQEMLDNGQPNYRKDKFDDDIFVSGKEYEVMISNVITPKQSGKKISFEIEFETTKLPFGVSIGTSLELEKK